jgi:hypothetical protein
MAGIGPASKPASKSRRRTPPLTYGAATPVTAPAAPGQARELGIENPHKLVVDMWAALQDSAEARFYSEADWARVSWELWHANKVLAGDKIAANSWAQIQHSLTELLISPAAKRRAAIELRLPTPDLDEVAAVSMMSRYQSKIKTVASPSS